MSKRRFPGGFPREPELPAIRQANALTSLISCRVLVLRQVEFAQETARDSQNGWMGDRPATGWPGTAVPVGSLRISAKGSECPIPAASARDSQQGWCYSTSGIGPLPLPPGAKCPIPAASARETARDSQQYLRDRPAPCLGTRFPARMVSQYLRDRPAPSGDSVRFYGKGHSTHPGTAGIALPLPRVGPVLQYLRDRPAPCLSTGIFFDFP